MATWIPNKFSRDLLRHQFIAFMATKLTQASLPSLEAYFTRTRWIPCLLVLLHSPSSLSCSVVGNQSGSGSLKWMHVQNA